MVCLAGIAAAPAAFGQFISCDVTSSLGGDLYAGAALFGSGGTVWNGLNRTVSASNLALNDSTGAPTSVTVSYTWQDSGFSLPTGNFADLGTSHILTGTVTLGGLTPGLAYDLAIYTAWSGSPSFTVDATTKSPSTSQNWSSLSGNVHYVRFQTVADVLGRVFFTPNANPTGLGSGSGWSSLQILAVPEPREYGMGAGVACLVAAAWLRHRRAKVA